MNNNAARTAFSSRLIEWLTSLPLRWAILLPTLFVMVVMLVTFLLLSYHLQRSLSDLENLQQADRARLQQLNQLDHDVIRTHLNIYEHLRLARTDIDEGEYLDRGKPLLLDIHALEVDFRSLADAPELDQEVTARLRTAIDSLVAYRTVTTNVIELATVELDLAEELLQESTREFLELNQNLLEVYRTIRHKLNVALEKSHASTQRQLYAVFSVIIVLLTLLLILGIYFANLLSSRLHQRIGQLQTLLSDRDQSIALDSRRGELPALGEVADRVESNLKQLEQSYARITRQEVSLNTALNSLVDGVITIDARGYVLSMNMAAQRMFGYPENDMIGKNIKVLMPDEYALHHDDYLRHYLSTGEEKIIGIGREVKGLKKNGEVFPLRLSVTEMPVGPDGQRTFIGSCHDMSDYKSQEAQLQRSQKLDALGKLSGGIAHDFNNLLGVVLGYAEVLELKLADKPKLASYAKQISHAAERGARLTNKLLAYTRRTATTAQICNLRELLLDNQGLLEKLLTARINIRFNLSHDLWTVWMDPGDFEDAIMNICINAMHAIDDHGEIVISAQNVSMHEHDVQAQGMTPGDYVMVRVQDDGCGIEEQNLNRIFDPFFSTKGDQGTGLGLTQVYGFIKRSGGAIRVESVVGNGTAMILFFPRFTDASSAGTER